MKYCIALLIILSNLLSFSQESLGLTSEEKAYFYHVVRKSPILDTNIGRYFEYRGPVIRFANKNINFDSIELVIINNPEMLLIRASEIAKSPKGIVSELTNKVALWELNKVLNAKRMKAKDFDIFQSKYERFENILTQKLPSIAIKTENDLPKPHPKLEQLLNPSLSFNDKKQFISTLNFLNLEDQLKVLQAVNDAVNEYVELRSYEFFQLLGAQADVYENVLIAAGDGSTTSGLLEEREKDEKGRWNKGLPKAIGFFPYQLEQKSGDGKNKPEIQSSRFATMDFKTVGNNKITNIHPDVWGYNDTKQTTVVIEKNGLSYHLFGSGETRFLSPDSSFSKGATFQSIINDLEKNKIAKIDEMIHGKRGYDYQIEYNTKKRDETELKIEKTEKMKFMDFGYSNVKTDKSSAREIKKHKRKNRKKGLDRPVSVTNTSTAGKKERRKNQQTIVELYNEYEFYKKKVEDLKKEKQIAIDQRAVLQRRLDYFKQMMGYRWATFTEKDGFYTFQDSSTFDLYTQEFQFKPTALQEEFEIRLISIPNDCMSDFADEVMLHINLTDAKPTYNARFQAHLTDVFESDKWELTQTLVQSSDSLAILQIFETILDNKLPIEVIARGQGIGQWNGIMTIDESESKEIATYPANMKMDSSFLRLRTSEALIYIDRGIKIEINSFTDPIASNIQLTDPDILEKMKSYKLSKNQLLSAYRSKTMLLKLKDELNVLAGTYFNREEAKKIIDRLNKEIQKAKISVGATSFKLEELK